MSSQLVFDRGRAAIAALLAFLLLVAGAVTAPAATALEGASATATVTTASPDAGLVVRITASGLPEVAFAYAAIIPAGSEGSLSGTGGTLAMNAFAPLSGGSLALDLVAPTSSLDRAAAYEVLIWRQHSNPTPENIYARAAISVTSEQWAAVFPAAGTTTTLAVDPAASSVAGANFTLRAIVEPAASGTVSYFNGDTQLGAAAVGTTITASIAKAGTAQLKAVFTPADSTAFTGSTSAVVSYDITAPPTAPTPTVTVSKTTGLDAAGETITVRGTGFLPNPPATSGTRPPLAGRFTGSYVVFGKFLDDWQPSAGAATSARKALDTRWGVLEADLATIGGAGAGGIVIGADGSFETTLTVSKTEASELLAGNYGVYTYPGGGAKYAPFETYTPITFAAPEPVAALDVTVTDASAVAGAKIHVAGSALGDITGAYAAVIEKGTESQVTAGGGYVAFAVPFPTITDGSTDFTVVAPTAKLDRTQQYEVLVWVQHSTPSVDTIYARADVPFTAGDWEKLFPGTLPPTDPEAPVEPGTPVTPPAAPQGAGSLSWAISSSFASYITGTIAHGSIAVSGGATRSGGLFQFGQATGGTYDAPTGTGTVSYTGSVRFTGHNGVLDVAIANPQVRITSPDAGTLYVTSGGVQVAFANLDLSAAVRVTANGTVTYSRVPATLTAAGRSQVLQGYTTELDPLAFTIGVAAAAPAGSTGTVAAAPAAAARTTPIPTTPPSSTGIELDGATLAALQKGEPVTVSAAGFTANEEGIQVVVYSTPTLLGTVTADASGTATWTGSLPATLADGEHTLTFQGSVDRGIRFTLARSAIAAGCFVEAAGLNWGFKETFRTYLEGIAAGGWELTDVAYEYPEFVWNAGTGAVDADTRTGLVTYGGSIRFTGHQGALDTTLSNARVELAGGTGYLVFDVSGTTQAGEPVTAAGIRFAEFALPDLEITDEGLVLDALPATLTEAGAAAFGTYAAGDALDPVSAVLPVATDCAVAPVATTEGEAPVAEAAEVEAISADPASAPVWPWAVGGIALALVIGAAVWIVVSRRRATAGGSGDQAAD